MHLGNPQIQGWDFMQRWQTHETGGIARLNQSEMIENKLH